MKKLKLDLSSFSNIEVVSREQLKKIMGGDGSGGSGGPGNSCFVSCGTYPNMGASCIGYACSTTSSGGQTIGINCDGTYYPC